MKVTGIIGSNVRLTNEAVDRRLAGRTVERVGDYVTGATKILFRCLIDGHEWMSSTNSIQRGHGCPKCSKNAKLNKDDLQEQLLDRNIEMVDDYTNATTKMRFRCMLDGYEWSTTMNSLRCGTGCPRCAGKEHITTEQFSKLIAHRTFVCIGGYSATMSKTSFKCSVPSCGHEWETTPNSILSRKTGCPNCADSGFNRSKPSIVYVYQIGEYCGYGITNNFKQRDKRHRTSFRKHSAKAKLIATYECSGEQALRIEAVLKKTFEVSDTGIEGFRKEATKLANLPRVLDLINSMLENQ
jgi:hypothetical protein